jgi:hypothetical protein|tara:strand:+ start:258 stop:407 length:150 start_codon:yes stop_codon:yes gene_type:complete
MGISYQILDQGAVHFVTFTVHQWVDDFTRDIDRERFTKGQPLSSFFPFL